MISTNKRAIACLGATIIALAIGKPAKANIFLNPDTGHYYEFVSGQHHWLEAKELAESRSHKGWQGYLATITSQAEQNFIASSFTTSGWGGWIGASDAAAEGVWEWVTGPEAGTVFLQDGISVGYNNFAPGQPNDFLGLEEYAHIRPDIGDKWNDLPSDISGITNPDHQIVGYYVEYGGLEPENSPKPVPEPGSVLGLLALGALGIVSRLGKGKSN
ncbi:MAG: lectin-like protein [Cyanobacteriota bacterium]|nr:lectin-like protein [Cyanobacteriota bacterium]